MKKGLTSKEIKQFQDLLIKANDWQLPPLRELVEAEAGKRMGEKTVQELKRLGKGK